MGKYRLRCLKCNKIIKDKYTNRCNNHNALLRTEYFSKRLQTQKLPGLWKFYQWLPVKDYLDYRDGSITYKSSNLAKELNLNNLYISFSGYFPERKCNMKTCTFKELEAPPTIQRAKEKNIKKIVVASAGNTARAFAYISKFSDIQITLVVPETCLDLLWLIEDATINKNNKLRLISLKKGYDYSDAIFFAERLSLLDDFTSEGGARNIARRDGMGTVLLDAVLKMKKLPKHYFQAVGSGTGAISVWEAAIRLKQDGRFGTTLPKMHLSQNVPFIPMVNAWNEKRRKIIPDIDMLHSRLKVKAIYANVLSNRNPPYSVLGGVYDTLKNCGGSMYSVTNNEAISAGKLFESIEDIDINPAACVAVSSLIKSVDDGKIDSKDVILLNITGGGEKRIKEKHTVKKLKPDFLVKDLNIPINDIF